MEADRKVKSVAKEVLSFVFHKHELTSVLPTPELRTGAITSDLIDNLGKVVWIESYYAWSNWKRFLRKHCNRIISSPKLYSTYFTFACYLLKEGVRDGYECFLSTLCLAAQFAMYLASRGHKEFLHVSADIFAVFYTKELDAKFVERGNWKKFNKYLQRRDSLKTFKSVMLSIEGEKKSPGEILEMLKVESDETFSINNRVLKDITQKEVEEDKQVIHFVEAIATSVEEMCKQAVAAEAERELQEQQKGQSPDAGSSASQSIEEPLHPEGGVSQEDGAIPSSSSASPYVGTRSLAISKAKDVLQDMLLDIAAITDLIKFVFQESPEVADF